MIRAYKQSERFLKTQMTGLTGHIEVAGYPFDRVEWGQADNIGKDDVYPWGDTWWAYEQTAYWVDGYTRAAILLKDEKLLERTKKMIYNVLENADDDGYLGPKFLKEVKDGCTRWPHVVFFRAIMALYEYNGDKTILDRLTKHYLGYKVDYASGRNILNVEIMLWLYGKTENKGLLSFAEENYIRYNELNKDNCYNDTFALSSSLPTKDNEAHGVSYNEYSKLGAILYAYTGNEKYLKASVVAYKKVDKHYMLIDGLHNCAEKLVSNRVDAQHETCNITDYTWSQNYLFEASGNTEYLDKIEKCVWNAGLGAVTEDFKALQYFSGVNQVVLDDESATGGITKGAAYKPAPYVQCCIGNVNRFMPNYILNSWKRVGKEVFLKLFCSSVFTDNGLTIKEETDFPYKNGVKLAVDTKEDFTLNLRIPKWSEGFKLTIDGDEAKANKRNGFLRIKVKKGKHKIVYTLQCTVKKHTEKDYVWFSKGAMVYTYNVRALWKIDKGEKRSSPEFPAYNIYPVVKWNYGIKDGDTFYEKGSKLFVKAYEVDNWQLRIIGQVSKLPVPPKKPTICGCAKEIELTPYGLSECRISAFARIK